MKDLENDKEIVELIRETSKDLRKLNFDLTPITSVIPVYSLKLP